MAIKKTQQGFALLIAVIFMSVMLSFGLTLGSLGYKQQVLASSAIQSQYAFYAADAALECALYADKRGNYDYPSPPYTCANPPPPSFLSPPAAYPDYRLDCRDTGLVSETLVSCTSSQWVITTRVKYNANDKHCADVTVYKYKDPQPPTNYDTYIFSQGYDVPCSTVASPGGARFVSRGLSSKH